RGPRDLQTALVALEELRGVIDRLTEAGARNELVPLTLDRVRQGRVVEAKEKAGLGLEELRIVAQLDVLPRVDERIPIHQFGLPFRPDVGLPTPAKSSHQAAQRAGVRKLDRVEEERREDRTGKATLRRSQELVRPADGFLEGEGDLLGLYSLSLRVTKIGQHG